MDHKGVPAGLGSSLLEESQEVLLDPPTPGFFWAWMGFHQGSRAVGEAARSGFKEV